MNRIIWEHDSEYKAQVNQTSIDWLTNYYANNKPLVMNIYIKKGDESVYNGFLYVPRIDTHNYVVVALYRGKFAGYVSHGGITQNIERAWPPALYKDLIVQGTHYSTLSFTLMHRSEIQTLTSQQLALMREMENQRLTHNIPHKMACNEILNWNK